MVNMDKEAHKRRIRRANGLPLEDPAKIESTKQYDAARKRLDKLLSLSDELGADIPLLKTEDLVRMSDILDKMNDMLDEVIDYRAVT